MVQTSLFPEIPVEFVVVDSEKEFTNIELRFAYGQKKDRPGMVGKSVGDLFYNTVSSSLSISLGDESKLTAESFRAAASAAIRWLQENHVQDVCLDVDSIYDDSLPDSVNALLEGFTLGAYEYTQYKSAQEPSSQVCLELRSKKVQFLDALVSKARIIANAVYLSRNWAHEPANVINPVSLVERTREVAQKYHLGFSVLDDRELEMMSANAIVSVGKGSANPSRMIILDYPGTDPSLSDHPVVLVGKTLTFDSGGYSLKAVESIKTMKYDKCGGMDVIAVLAAASELKLKPRIVGIIGAAENLVSGNSYRPDDILRTLSGKTVEIITTDAEGRLVLADCLTYAQQKYSPRALIDLATLTSGVVIALGRIRGGLFSNDDTLAESLFSSGESTHERLWRFPLDEEYLKAMQGSDADLKNAGGKEGHAILAAMFLKEFINPGTSWAHIDIAGMADTAVDLPYCRKGATGFGVRLLIDYLQKL